MMPQASCATARVWWRFGPPRSCPTKRSRRKSCVVDRLIETITLLVLLAFLTASAGAAETVQLTVGGQVRAFLLERPVAQGPRPTIIMLHGAGRRAADIAGETALAQIAPREGWVAAFPEGRGSRWNFFPPGKESCKRRPILSTAWRSAGRRQLPQSSGCRPRSAWRVRPEAHLYLVSLVWPIARRGDGTADGMCRCRDVRCNWFAHCSNVGSDRSGVPSGQAPPPPGGQRHRRSCAAVCRGPQCQG